MIVAKPGDRSDIHQVGTSRLTSAVGGHHTRPTSGSVPQADRLKVRDAVRRWLQLFDDRT